jgi:N-acetylglucosaminyl-diphospho-decaprenol L-rhamnosyltransferase
MNVSIILVAYHADKWLPACIGSLVGASARRMHLVLVDNSGNTCIGSLKLDDFDYEIVKTPEPMGFAEANNYALVNATRLEEAVLFLNQDTISPPGWIDSCLDCLGDNDRLGAVSPVIRTYDDTGWDPSFLACLPSTDILENAGEGWFTTSNAPAPALIVRAAVLRKTGPFDPVFGSYYEDYDLCRRIRMLGFQVGFCRTAKVRHYSGSTTTDRTRELKRMRQILRNRMLYLLRENGRPSTPLLAALLVKDLAHRLIRGLLRRPSSQPPAVTLKAYGDLLGVADRLVSQKRDDEQWVRYLDDLGWPQNVPGLRGHASSVILMEAG